MRRRKSKAERSVSLDEVMPAFNDGGHLAVDIDDWSERASDSVLAQEANGVIEVEVGKLDEKYRPSSPCVTCRASRQSRQPRFCS